MPGSVGGAHDGADLHFAKTNNAAYILDERRRVALSDVDNAKFCWFHTKVCIVASVGFFTDAYDIFAVNIASAMLGYIYGSASDDPSSTAKTLTRGQDLGLKVATPVGTLLGQLFFGWLADRLGRKRMYGVELMVIIVATFGQALSGSGGGLKIIGVLIVWRFILGIGIGGDYPVSAVIASEFASTKIRGRMMTVVFAAQGWGNLAACLVAVAVVAAYKDGLTSELQEVQLDRLDSVWRLLIGLGCVPGAIALYFRLTIPETPRFTMDVDRNVQQAEANIESTLKWGTFNEDPDVVQRAKVQMADWVDFFGYFSQWKNLKILIGTSYSWFALDIGFYGLGLNSAIILQAIGFGTEGELYKSLINICVGNIILSLAGLIPGYWVCFCFIDRARWGRKKIQIMGFVALTILFLIMGTTYNTLNLHPSGRKGFVVFYCLANFFTNFGPNTTTFIIPGEVFTTRYRSTAYGISAASGKIGAIIAQIIFDQLSNRGADAGDKHLDHILEIYAVFMFTGIFSTLLLEETMNKTLEELSNESQTDFITGIAGLDINMHESIPMLSRHPTNTSQT